jgi:hypothetical protein
MTGMKDIETTVGEDNCFPGMPAAQLGRLGSIEQLRHFSHHFFVLQ